ncbi:MAG: hypothetical protein M0Q94_14170 [Candidatus Cloacimonetes bacterium]|nr:hypothetical protein [Candidatus Cloacimonadota bacterium]
MKLINKPKFFVDFDCTITDSIKAFSDTYNYRYRYHPEFKPADPNKIQRYNFEDICPLVKNALNIFEDELFFKYLKFINDNTYEVLRKLNEKYQLIICSIGTPENAAYKALYLKDKLPFIKDYILITNQNCKMDKGIVNMKDAIFMDDIPSNLISSSAKNKILFGKIYPWNKEGLNKYEHCLNWSEVEERYL